VHTLSRKQHLGPPEAGARVPPSSTLTRPAPRLEVRLIRTHSLHPLPPASPFPSRIQTEPWQSWTAGKLPARRVQATVHSQLRSPADTLLQSPRAGFSHPTGDEGAPLQLYVGTELGEGRQGQRARLGRGSFSERSRVMTDTGCAAAERSVTPGRQLSPTAPHHEPTLEDGWGRKHVKI